MPTWFRYLLFQIPGWCMAALVLLPAAQLAWHSSRSQGKGSHLDWSASWAQLLAMAAVALAGEGNDAARFQVLQARMHAKNSLDIERHVEDVPAACIVRSEHELQPLRLVGDRPRGAPGPACGPGPVAARPRGWTTAATSSPRSPATRKRRAGSRARNPR